VFSPCFVRKAVPRVDMTLVKDHYFSACWCHARPSQHRFLSPALSQKNVPSFLSFCRLLNKTEKGSTRIEKPPSSVYIDSRKPQNCETCQIITASTSTYRRTTSHNHMPSPPPRRQTQGYSKLSTPPPHHPPSFSNCPTASSNSAPSSSLP
jgi:hypothetical protein